KHGHREADCGKKKTLSKSTVVSLVKKGETIIDIAGKEEQGPNGISVSMEPTKGTYNQSAWIIPKKTVKEKQLYMAPTQKEDSGFRALH
ncbi:hypothetical protein HAX54_022072, partial [Datura stramonium]|nr:hypothetical protein [Datura stramonium]